MSSGIGMQIVCMVYWAGYLTGSHSCSDAAILLEPTIPAYSEEQCQPSELTSQVHTLNKECNQYGHTLNKECNQYGYTLDSIKRL